MFDLTGKKNKELTSFSISKSGDMRGGFYSMTLSARDGYALLSFTEAKSYNQAPETEEYRVDKKALAEIEDIFIKNGMYRWDGKKFTNAFVSDMASTGYSFNFQGGSVSFSSQIYPKKYADKLQMLTDIIEKYRDIARQTML